MLELLKTSSRVEAFHGTDDYLADRFGLRGKSTVGRILKRLKQSKKIISDVHRTEENGQWRCWRKIYLVSRASAEVGAIQLCLLVMELGLVEGTSQEVVKLCGRLQCTPQQMSTWAEVAEKKGWLELTREPWRLAVPPHQRTAVWDARDRLGVRLPNRRAKETRDSNGKLIASASTWRPLPIAAQPTTRELLRAHLRRAVAIDGYTLETTPELSRAIGRSTAQVKVALDALCAAGEFHRRPVSAPGCKKGRIISAQPLSDDAASKLGRRAAVPKPPAVVVPSELVNRFITEGIAVEPDRYRATPDELPAFAVPQRFVDSILAERGGDRDPRARPTEHDLADRIATYFLDLLRADARERRLRLDAHRIAATAAAVRRCAARLVLAALTAGLIGQVQAHALATKIRAERATWLASLATEPGAEPTERGVLMAANVLLVGIYLDWTKMFRSVVPAAQVEAVAEVLAPALESR